MFGMIRRYLKGRARIIAKGQLAQSAKKVVRSVKDAKLLKTKVKSQILAFIVSISVITAPTSTSATPMIVSNPEGIAQAYTFFMENLEKYNNMIKTAQDSLDTLNRVNDIMNTASSQLNNLQIGLADPRQLKSRFESNIKAIEDNAKRIAKNLEEKDWANAFYKFEYTKCTTKWKKLKEEYKEYQKKQASKNLNDAYKDDNGSEESQANINKNIAKFNDAYNDRANAIEQGIEYLEVVEKQGIQAGISKMHEWANAAQKYIDVKNSKYVNPEAAIRPVDKYKTQADLCQQVKEAQIEFDIQKAKMDYWEAIAEGRYADAQKHFTKWELAENKKAEERKNETKKVLVNNDIYFAINNINGTLDINEKTGEITPEKDWQDLSLENPAELLTIPQTDDKGNTTNIQRWVAKQDTIRYLMERQKFNEALSLQNKRNMIIAMQGDTQAIQKAQLETFTILSKQIKELNNSVNAIGNIASHFLKMKFNIQEDNMNNMNDEDNNEKIQNTTKDNLAKNLQKTLGTFEDKFESDAQTGRIKFKDKNKDTSGILP